MEGGLAALARPLPGADVGEPVVVAQGLALVGLALLAEVAAAGFLAVERIEAHERGELEEIGDAPRALELARDAASAVPDVERVWWVLLDCALELADHAWTSVALERLVLTFRGEPALIAESFDLAEFEASPESAAWRDARDRAPSGN